LSLRERKKRETREALVAAALRLFQTHGFDRVRVDEIAAEAGVSRSSFFRYFTSKEAVAFAGETERLSEFARTVERSIAEAGRFAVLRSAAAALAESYTLDRHRIVQRERLVEASRELGSYRLELDELWEAELAEALVAGKRPSRNESLHARVLAAALVGARRATLRRWVQSAGRDDLGKMVRRALDWLEHGFDREDGSGPGSPSASALKL
jgi:AcrR family transcriptional regulator